MLLRMYARWAERRGFDVEVDAVSRGHRGRHPLGRVHHHRALRLRADDGERGTHRLVRISPFDNQARRQTSFAAVQVWPVIDAADVELNDADIRMEVFRASAAPAASTSTRRRRPCA